MKPSEFAKITTLGARKPKKPTKKPKPASLGESTFLLHLKSYKLEHLFEREHRFHEVRGWRFDYACAQHRIAVEIEGGTKWGNSRHSKGAGFIGDCDKYNTATMMGWEIYRFSTEMVLDATAIDFIRDLLKFRGIT